MKNLLLISCISVFMGLQLCAETSDTESSDSSNNCPSKNCSDFETQSQAQSIFNSNRNCYKNLDSDGDEIACENLPN